MIQMPTAVKIPSWQRTLSRVAGRTTLVTPTVSGQYFQGIFVCVAALTGHSWSWAVSMQRTFQYRLNQCYGCGICFHEVWWHINVSQVSTRSIFCLYRWHHKCSSQISWRQTWKINATCDVSAHGNLFCHYSVKTQLFTVFINNPVVHFLCLIL